MKSLKFLIFNWRCWLNPEMGGAEIYTREIATRWVKAGHTVTLFTSKFSGAKSEEIVDGVRIVRSGGRFSVYSKAKKFYLDRFRQEGFDVIIDEINTRPFFVPQFANNGEKVFALIHQLAREYWFYETPFPINFLGYHFFEFKWLKDYTNIPTITVSDSTKQDLVDLGFKKIFVVQGGLNFKPLTVVPERTNIPIIAYVGRLKSAKRPDHAIQAFNIIKKKIPEIELWILGDGPIKKDLEKMDIKNVKFFSELDNASRRNLIKQVWILVNPSVREGWGLNVIEAAALGVPCVGYNVGGLRDSIRDGKTGLLVKNGEIESLAEGLLQILQDTMLRFRLSENSLKYASCFNWERTFKEFNDVLRCG